MGNWQPPTAYDESFDNNPTKQNVYDQLISLGYAHKYAFDASIECNNIQQAINWIDDKQRKEKNDNDKKDRETCVCNGSIMQCIHFTHFRDAMHSYRGCNAEQYDITEILNGFHHLLSEHDTEEEFESIYLQLIMHKCTFSDCNLLKRNHRNRNTRTVPLMYNTNNINDIVSYQILDKIHCYYSHSYHMGYRMSSKQRNNIETQLMSVDEEKTDDTLLRNTDFCVAQALIKQQNRSTIRKNVHKFTRPTLYGIGQIFVYEDEYSHRENSAHMRIRKKHENLKQELVDNKLASINAMQYASEFGKMERHFRGIWRKHHYPKLTQDALLAVMIYCNYDHLQSIFSKTYWDEEWVQAHGEFYHLGKLLKSAMSRAPKLDFFIQNETKQFIQTTIHLYHGVTEELAFETHQTCHIWSPLSTTTSLEVACNFTVDQGFVVEFEVTRMRMDSFGKNNRDHYISSYFTCEWCSDFTNEKEHLFVQSANNIKIVNIIQSAMGMEYGPIFRAILILTKLTMYYRWEQDVSVHIQNIMTRMIEHQLWKSNSQYFDCGQYSKFGELNTYTQDVVDRFCNEKEYVEVYFDHIKIYHDYLRGLIFYCDMDWIKLCQIITLFPNITIVEVHEIEIHSKILADILRTFPLLPMHFKKIVISNKKNHNSQPSKVCNKEIQEKFNRSSIKLTVIDGYYGSVTLERL
eukprot:279232_1